MVPPRAEGFCLMAARRHAEDTWVSSIRSWLTGSFLSQSRSGRGSSTCSWWSIFIKSSSLSQSSSSSLFLLFLFSVFLFNDGNAALCRFVKVKKHIHLYTYMYMYTCIHSILYAVFFENVQIKQKNCIRNCFIVCLMLFFLMQCLFCVQHVIPSNLFFRFPLQRLAIWALCSLAYLPCLCWTRVFRWRRAPATFLLRCLDEWKHSVTVKTKRKYSRTSSLHSQNFATFIRFISTRLTRYVLNFDAQINQLVQMRPHLINICQAD